MLNDFIVNETLHTFYIIYLRLHAKPKTNLFLCITRLKWYKLEWHGNCLLFPLQIEPQILGLFSHSFP